MSPEKLTRLRGRTATAADVVEAIDDPGLQRRRGWDLTCWRYHLVPWGVRFTYRGPDGGGGAEILTVIHLGAGVPGALRDGARLTDGPC